MHETQVYTGIYTKYFLLASSANIKEMLRLSIVYIWSSWMNIKYSQHDSKRGARNQEFQLPSNPFLRENLSKNIWIGSNVNLQELDSRLEDL